MSSTTAPASAVPATELVPAHVVEDLQGIVQLLSDGTVKRFQLPQVLPPPPVRWKDVVYDETHNLSLRVFVPPLAGAEKLPVIVYFHGGGFVINSYASTEFHAACLRLAGELPAVVLSVDYRLAPEHRLPAAHDDADAFFSWLRAQAAATTDLWLAESADFGRVFVSGDSAGGNIAHHAIVRIGSGALATGAARVAGCILLYPFFGGEQRTASEAACPDDVYLTLTVSDQMWRLALPAGASRDHPLANPFGPDSPALDSVALPPLLVVTGDRDMLVDRIRDYVARLNATGNKRAEFPGKGHAFFSVEHDDEVTGEMIRVVLRPFVHGGAAAPAR
jgi:acetyl esterase/lipase